MQDLQIECDNCGETLTIVREWPDGWKYRATVESCLYCQNTILNVWAADLLALLNGKPKSIGIRGGVLLEQVENRIAGLVAAQQSAQADAPDSCQNEGE